MKRKSFDKIILGAGFYGMYSALRCGKRGERVAVVERDPAPFMRASYANQARVHMGYHYPRSLSTAIKSAGYFERFEYDYGFCIENSFDQVYATSARLGWTNAREFERFCHAAGIRCEEMPTGKYFKPDVCDGAFLTKEYTYDAQVLKRYFLDEFDALPNVKFYFGITPESIAEAGSNWEVGTGEMVLSAPFLLNATYAGVNNVHKLVGAPPFDIKYELCEVILCEASGALSGVGITVMDGPFFSIMPFGKTGLHSLTSVTFTPHSASHDDQPSFLCQSRSGGLCKAESLGNCNGCHVKPSSSWPYMSSLARKYLKDDLGFSYKMSLFSMKPVLKASEIDDSRPTVIRIVSKDPTMVSVLSGKINTVYDLDTYLDGEAV